MSALRDLVTVAHLTLLEALRRRILLAALVCGGAFLLLFATGLHFMLRDISAHGGLVDRAQRALILNFLTLAGLYAVNFLTVMAAVLLPVDTLSGEIASGVVQTLASKPVRRSTIVLGKWCAYALVVCGYLLFLAGGVLAIVRLLAGFTPPHPGFGLPLMALEGLVLLSLSIAGGTRLATVTNGIVAFGLYGLAFLGNWVEQIGTINHNTAAINVGTVASLIMPSESLWMLAAHAMQPAILRQGTFTPFSPVSVPSNAMILWAACYIVAALVFALRTFGRRAL